MRGSRTFSASSVRSDTVSQTFSSPSAAEPNHESGSSSAGEYSSMFWNALSDRRVCYRDDILLDKLLPKRAAVTKHILDSMPAGEKEKVSLKGILSHLKREKIINNEDAEGGHKHISHILLILSDFVRTPRDLATVLDDSIHSCGGWKAERYVAVFQSLIPIVAMNDTEQLGLDQAMPSSAFGERRLINREDLGELAGLYMGHALRHFAQDPSLSIAMMDSVWSAFFIPCCIAQMSPKLLDLWWNKMLKFYDDDGGVACTKVKPIPFEAVYGLLAATADNLDIERTLRVFHEANRRGLRLAVQQDGLSSLPPQSLTERSEDLAVQHIQLQILAKLMATAKISNADGGLRELVVKDVKRLISPDVLMTARWEIVNDVLSGLSVSSAMHLVKARSAADQEGDEAVPFFIWASLLRRCARDHYIDEAEALFSFIRFRFPSLAPMEEQELFVIMMRMYGTLSPPDAGAVLHTFLQRPGEGMDAKRKNTPLELQALYSILVKGADSQNASMMYFLEACAAGVPIDVKMFDAVMGSSARTLRSLSKKLPFDYTSSSLDAMIRIPANVDAHLRREEAQIASGMPIYDSTGDAL